MLFLGRECSRSAEAISLCCMSLAWLLFAPVFALPLAFRFGEFRRVVQIGQRLWGRCQGQQLLQKTRASPWCMRQNLNYVRVPKTASSTVQHTLWHVAARYGLYGGGKDVCVHSPSCAPQWEPFLAAMHSTGQEKDRNLSRIVKPALPIFHLTFVRDPVERMISHFYYFEVGELNVSASPKNLLRYLRTQAGTFERDYIRREVTSPSRASAESILDAYGFVGVTERMDESMLLLRHELGLSSLCDVLFLNYKNTTAAPNGPHTAPHIPTSAQPKKLRDYIASAAFRRKMLPDIRLHAAANARMDRLIDRVGIKEFRKELVAFRRLLRMAPRKCRRGVQFCYTGSGACCLDKLCADGHEVSKL